MLYEIFSCKVHAKLVYCMQHPNFMQVERPGRGDMGRGT